MQIKKFMKKCAVTASLSIALSFSVNSTSYAADASFILAQIKFNTDIIIYQISQLPAYVASITEMAMSWINTEDKAHVMANNQYGFGMLSSNYNASISDQISLTKELTTQFILANGAAKPLPQLEDSDNDVSALSLLGTPLTGKSKDINASAKNYLKNVTDANASLTRIRILASKPSTTQYVNFYSTLSAIKSYDTFVLSGLYNQQNKEILRNYLIGLATNSDWFKQVGSEPLGLVLRQILMYQSQMYVQMDRLIKIEQQHLAISAMTNSLIMVSDEQMLAEPLLRRST